MSDRASPVVGFGFDLGAGELIEIPEWKSLTEATHNCEDEKWPVQLVEHGHHEYRFWFLAVRGTVKRDAEWGSIIELGSFTRPADEKIAAAKEWCRQKHIPWSEPQLVAMATYD